MFRYLKKWKWGDILILTLTAVLALGMWGLSAYGAVSAGDEAMAVVRLADGSELTVPLVDDHSEEIALESGAYAYILLIKSGRIQVLRADCPDQVCVLTGWLSRPGQTAACVPGRLLVRIITEDGQHSDDDVDVVAQ